LFSDFTISLSLRVVKQNETKMNKSNGSIGTESSHSNDSGCYNNSYSNGGHNYNNLINQLLPNSIKNGLNNFAPKTAASLNDQFDVITLADLLLLLFLLKIY